MGELLNLRRSSGGQGHGGNLLLQLGGDCLFHPHVRIHAQIRANE